MKITLIYISIFFITASTTFAQEESIIMKAMKDELNRTMTDMRYEGHDKPFYISYAIDDSRNFSIYASLGATFGARDFHTREKGIRILVGDYEFNDESLDNDQFSDPSAHELELPLEDDYFGIRRALWTSTDMVYKGAAQKFKKNQATLKEKNKTLKELPHRTFAKIAPFQLIEKIPATSYDQKTWEKYCRDLSAIFKEVPALESSSVFLTFNRVTRYFVNSEGTTAMIPETFASIHINGQVKTDDDVPLFEQVIRYGRTLDELPSYEELKRETINIVEKLKLAKQVKQLEEEYSGPVLFIGEPVMQVFSNTAFVLNASNALPGKENYGGDQSSIDNKLGKLFIDNTITIKATPTLKNYKGKALIGSFVMDGEGVKAPDEVILVEKGILKNLMNDRTLTKPDQVANGFNDGPGVIQAFVDKGVPVETLKQKLIDAAKEEGQDFALIVRGKSGVQMGQIAVYKVNLENGSEELMGPARMNNLQPRDLKKLSATSAQTAYQLPLGRNGVMSCIVPDAVLIGQAQITPMSMQFLKDEITYVESPLKN